MKPVLTRHPRFLIFLILLLLVVDISADYFFGDQNGIIGKGRISKAIFVIQYLLLILWLVIKGAEKHKILFLQVAFFLIIWAALESMGYVLIHLKEQPVYQSLPYEIFDYDRNLGIRSRPNSTEEKIETTTWGNQVFQATYHTDAFGRRLNPVKKDSCRQYALFFGGSFTFGEGVEDDETLPVRFQQHSPSFCTYNYGFNGYGPHHMLTQLLEKNLAEEVKQQEGIVVYTFIYDHLKRVYGNMSRVTSFGWNSPHYGLKDGKVFRKGNFDHSRPYLVRKLFHMLDYSYVLHYLNVDWPLKITEYHYRLTAAVIEAACREYQKQFGNQPFFVVVFPDQPNDILAYIDDPGIIKLDYSNLFEQAGHILHPVDTHPNARAYQIVGKQLSDDIEKYVSGAGAIGSE